MPVQKIDKFPDNHPFKGGLIVIGMRPPKDWKEKLRKQKEDEEAKKAAVNPEENPVSPGDGLELPDPSAEK